MDSITTIINAGFFTFNYSVLIFAYSSVFLMVFISFIFFIFFFLSLDWQKVLFYFPISNYSNEYNMATEISKDLFRICSQSKMHGSRHEIHRQNTHFQLLM